MLDNGFSLMLGIFTLQNGKRLCTYQTQQQDFSGGGRLKRTCPHKLWYIKILIESRGYGEGFTHGFFVCRGSHGKSRGFFLFWKQQI
jgi:hypothetical protein